MLTHTSYSTNYSKSYEERRCAILEIPRVSEELKGEVTKSVAEATKWATLAKQSERL